MSSSCNWLLANSEYNSLLTTTVSNTLRIIGRPGEGKTTLAAFIVTTLQERVGTCLLYFFCKAGDAEKRLPIHVMRSLVSQLWRLNPTLIPLMERWYQNSGRPNADSFSELCTMFSQLISVMGAGTLFIIIDALDELHEPQELVDSLRKCQIQAPRIVETLYTSRDYPDLHLLFKSQDERISIPVEVVKQSILIYVDKRLSRMRFVAGTSLHGRLVPAIANASEGLWLYARLILDDIQQASSPAELEASIACLPSGLRELYSSILASVQHRFSSLQIRIAQQIFLWLDGADYMPWWHFHSNDMLEDNVLSLLVRFANNGGPVFDPLTLIQQLCFPLINVFESGTDGLECLYAASFVHFSAEQYLQWSSSAPLRMLPIVLRQRRLRRLHRGITAAWYFTHSDDFQEVLKQLREDPHGNGVGAYFEMAYGMGDSWHMATLPEGLEREELDQLDDLCRPLIKYIVSCDCLGWAEAAILINYAGGFMNLIENVEKALRILADKPSKDDPLPWQQYVEARRTFFVDFTYVLRTTGPGYQFMEEPLLRPEGFETREVAMGILALGQQYQYHVDQVTVLTDLEGKQRENKDRSRAVGPREWTRRKPSESPSK